MMQEQLPSKAISQKKNVSNCALCSRIFVLTLSCVFNTIIPDHNANAFISPTNPHEKNSTFCDSVVNFLFGGLVRWDAQYFLHVSRYGYTFENTLAFFPLYPIITYLFSFLLYAPLSGVLSWSSVTIISAVAVNIYVFVKAAEVLYELTLKVLKNYQLAYVASVMFCVNPASIFFSAPYSETLFSFFTFYGMLLYVTDFNILSSLSLGLSTATRSNGTLNVWFPLFKIAITIFQNYAKRVKYLHRIQRKEEGPGGNVSLISICLRGTLICLVSLTPFVAFQIYSYFTYCTTDAYDVPAFLASYAHKRDLVLPGSRYLPWCEHDIILPYLYVQQHYWNVGFLKYYEFKQIPNFLLAFPIIFLIFSMTFCFVKLHTNFKVPFFDLQVESSSGIPLSIFPFIAHAMGLTVFCILNIHIQVTTRMMASSSPVLYWFVAYILTGKLNICKKHNKKNVPKKSHKLPDSNPKLENWWNILITTVDVPMKQFSSIIKLYFFSYLFTGTALFSNFFPWT